ncbi:MAG TPA: DUF4157 domain-containing protein, partial [Kofleriaceae bacterium]|nr:DUF4157 domain-containing protein [Kofleriaceae bacterium]
ADALGARAFTLGNHIYFNRDQFTPDTPSGERLLIHELMHVVQYDERRLPHADGRFKASDPGSATEREARAAEDSASRLSPKDPLRGPVPAPPPRTTATGPAVAEIQRAPQDPPQTPAARVAFVREEGLNLRAGPDQKTASYLRQMKFGQRVHVLEDAGKGEWLKIAVLGQTGYVYKPRIHFPPQDLIEKDPGLTLIKVKPGQTFWGLVKEAYGIQGNESSRDQNINHFINAIRAVNKPEAFKVKTDILALAWEANGDKAKIEKAGEAAFKVDPTGKAVPKGPSEVKNPYPRGSVQHDEFTNAVMNAGHRSLPSP